MPPASRAQAGVSSNNSVTADAKAPTRVAPRSSAPLLASAEIYSSTTTALLVSAGPPYLPANGPSDESSPNDANPPSIASTSDATDASRALSGPTTMTYSIPQSLGSYYSIGSYSHSLCYGRTISNAGGAAACRHPPHQPPSQQPTTAPLPWTALACRSYQPPPWLLHLQPTAPPPWPRQPAGSLPDSYSGVAGGEDGSVPPRAQGPRSALRPRRVSRCSAVVVAEQELEPWLQFLEEGSEGEDELEGGDGGGEEQAEAPSALTVRSGSGSDGSGPNGDGEPPQPPAASIRYAGSWTADTAERRTTFTPVGTSAAAVSAPDLRNGDAPRAAPAAATAAATATTTATTTARVSTRGFVNKVAVGTFPDVIAGSPASKAVAAAVVAAAAVSGASAPGAVTGWAGGNLVDADAGWLEGNGPPAAAPPVQETGGVRTAFAGPVTAPADVALACAAANVVGRGSRDLYGGSDRRSATQPGAVSGTEWSRGSRARCSSSAAAAAAAAAPGAAGPDRAGGRRLVGPRRLEAADTDPTAAAFGCCLGGADAGAGGYDRAPRWAQRRRVCFRGYLQPGLWTTGTAAGAGGSRSAASATDAGDLAAAATSLAGTAASGRYDGYGSPRGARREAVQLHDGELVRDAGAWVLATDAGYGAMYGASRYCDGGAAALYGDGDEDDDDDDLAAAAVPYCRGGAGRVRQVGYRSDDGGRVGRVAAPAVNTPSCRGAPAPGRALILVAAAAAAAAQVDVSPVGGDWDSLWSAEEPAEALPGPQPGGPLLPPPPPPPPLARPQPQGPEAAAAAARARTSSLTVSSGPLLDLPDAGLAAALAAVAATCGSPLVSTGAAAAEDCLSRRSGDDDGGGLRVRGVGDPGVAVGGGGARAARRTRLRGGLCGFLRGLVLADCCS